MLPAHRFAELFPPLEGAPFDELVEDIRLNGIRDPITLYEGAILDGRNRYRALLDLRDTGELRGAGWGAYEGEPVTDEDLAEDLLLPWFCRFSPGVDGDPLRYVLSKNLHRRHLDESQRAMVAARLATMRQGERTDLEPAADLRKAEDETEPSANLPKVEPARKIDQAAAAELLNVSSRSVRAAKVVQQHGAPELAQAVDQGKIAVSAAEQIARKSEGEQQQELAARGLAPPINGARAIMASRAEPDDSLDYFPTPPWATRALMERVLPRLGISPQAIGAAWEPACGEGHMAEVLREYVRFVHASDVFDYGYRDAMGELVELGDDVRDFLAESPGTAPIVTWIITNPPFGDRSIAFVLNALDLAPNVAMFFRSQWAVEGIERYEQIFRDRPPTLCAFFSERVNLCKGRWDPEGTTATAYCWLVWVRDAHPRPPLWIAPGCRKEFTRSDDVERFTAHPVQKKRAPGTASAGPPCNSSGPPRVAGGKPDAREPAPTAVEGPPAGAGSFPDPPDIPAALRRGDPACRLAMSISTPESPYHFTGTKTDVVRQIGQAVPRRTGRALAWELMRT